MNQAFSAAWSWFRHVTSGDESPRGKKRKMLPGLLAASLGLGLITHTKADILNFAAEIDGAQAFVCAGSGSPAKPRRRRKERVGQGNPPNMERLL